MDDRELIERRRRQRTLFLERLYDEADADVSRFVSAWDVATAIGMSEADARRVLEYFAEKGFVHVDDHRAGTVRLTAAGLDYIEDRRLG